VWTIRVTLLIALGTLVSVDSFLIRRRKKYPRLSESRALNIALVAVHMIVMCALVTLPPAGGWGARAGGLQGKGVCIGFLTMGTALVGAGIGLASLALRQRKAFGAQSSQDGLITSRAYRYFRHPIYTGSLWLFLGLALLTRNPDGLLVFPAIFLAYLALILLEEQHELRPTFGEQYQAYRRTTGMFGPVWLWGGILVALLLIAISAWI
jgi:protein-S-isoprenylcysteine O-methyltransferase Ste14